jgi:DNA excision repair protein ERCC-4
VHVQVIADIAERPSGVPRLLAELGVMVQTRRLWGGDYLVGNRALVERKTVRGLHAAIINGTFWPQVGRLREGTLFAYLLLEGKDIDDGPLGAAAIRGTCIALMDLGVGLIRATDARDSALWLQRLAVRRASALYRNRPAYAQRPKRGPGAPAAEAALGAVPGISRASAAALLRHFGTLAAIVRAGPDDWMRVPGIGPARARGLAETFHTPQTASRARQSRDRREAPST